MTCVKTFCYRLSGRGPSQGNVPLRSAETTPPEEAARAALPQVQHLQLQYEQLLPCLLDALASARCSQARAQRISSTLTDLIVQLQGIAATGSQRATMPEVSVNCNVSVAGSDWRTKRVVLRAEGFILVDRNSQDMELTRWSEVSSPGPEASEPSMVETPRGPLHRVTRWWRSSSEDVPRSNMYQAELQLRNQRITLQFGAAGPPELMKELWQASQGSRAVGPGEKVRPLLDLLGRCLQGDLTTLEVMTMYREPLPMPVDLAEVRRQLSLNGEANLLHRMHEATKAERVVSEAWTSLEVLSPGEVKFFEYKQILPGGLGPSETRVSTVYHLEAEHPDQVILHKVTKPWDVPFKDDFLVYHKHIFTKVAETTEMASAATVCLQVELGIAWIGSPLKLGAFKSIIRQNTKSETRESGQALARCLAS